MGDGAIVEFASVVDAVACAVAVQKAVADRQAKTPADKRIVFRIGVNLGDVVVEGDDLLGDGVNVAARLEQLCEPGGVLVSGTAFDHLQGRLGMPLGVHRRAAGQEHRPAGTGVSGQVGWQGGRLPSRHRLGRRLMPLAAAALLAVMVLASGWWFWPAPAPSGPASIAVLPFDNISGDAEQGYLADGMTEDMTTDLARVPNLLVISRNAAFQYKGKAIEPAQVAAELGVRYILEGSVRRIGDELRINAQLIDAGTGLHKWAERFDGAWQDVFALQDKVIASVVNALELRLATGERLTQGPGGTRNPAAYDAYLRGLELYWRDTPEDAAKAVTNLKQAVALDPTYGEAYAALAEVYRLWSGSTLERALGTSTQGMTADVVAYLQEAMKYPSPRAYRIAADKLISAHQSDEAIEDLERAIALDPSDAESYGWMAWAMSLAGRPLDAQRFIDAAIACRSARRSVARRLRRFCRLHRRPLRGCRQSAGKVRGRIPSASLGRDACSWLPTAISVAMLAPLIRKLDTFNRQEGDVGFSQVLARVWIPYARPEDAARLREGLRKAGVPEFPFDYPTSMDRLTDDEIRSTLFGHTLKGRDLDSGAKWILTFAADGAFTFASDSAYASAPSEAGRLVEVQDGVMCWGYPATGSRGCGALFRPRPGAGGGCERSPLDRPRGSDQVLRGPVSGATTERLLQHLAHSNTGPGNSRGVTIDVRHSK